jgi:hypothetical protein
MPTGRVTKRMTEQIGIEVIRSPLIIARLPTRTIRFFVS